MSTEADKSRNDTSENVEGFLDQAVDEGKRDVADLQATGAVLVDNAMEMVVKVT